MFLYSRCYTTVIGELAKQCEIRFIDLDEKGIDKLMKSYDFYTECEIPENTYVGQTEAVRTVGVKAVLLASDKLSEKKVKEIQQKFYLKIRLNFSTFFQQIFHLMRARQQRESRSHFMTGQPFTMKNMGSA